ncbi:MAG: hypothetical protein JO250_19965 [Armatimonadetes bacterium]|nr:hypothetical protein [Armatimonadota bacterium]
MPTCPSCGATERQHKAGTNKSGTGRRECQACGRTYTPDPKAQGYARPRATARPPAARP